MNENKIIWGLVGVIIFLLGFSSYNQIQINEMQEKIDHLEYLTQENYEIHKSVVQMLVDDFNVTAKDLELILFIKPNGEIYDIAKTMQMSWSVSWSVD